MLSKGISRLDCCRDVGHSYVVDTSFKFSSGHASYQRNESSLRISIDPDLFELSESLIENSI